MVLFQCVGWCVGGGVQSRGVRCADPTGCASGRAPEVTQTCSIRKQCEAQWFTGKYLPFTQSFLILIFFR